MGIQSYLKRVSKATSDIKDAINTKGGTCSECDSIETLANAVLAIPTGTSDSGDALFTVLAFKSTDSQPSTPSGGSWSNSATSISYPSGWSDGSGMTSNIWMSYKVYKADGNIYKDWVSPIKVSGSSSTVDLSNYATQTWVTEQITKASTGGTVDLSAYATEDWVNEQLKNISGSVSVDLSKYVLKADIPSLLEGYILKTEISSLLKGYALKEDIPSLDGYATKEWVSDEIAKIDTGGSSDTFTLNGITESAAITAGTGITIATSKSSKTITISTTTSGSGTGTGKDGDDGDTYRTFQIYQYTDSRIVAPTISNGALAYWDIENNELVNCPSGWATDEAYEADKYLWISSAVFSKKSGGSIIGSWETPRCITGPKGDSGTDGVDGTDGTDGSDGKDGKDGTTFEFIYALTADEKVTPAYPKSATDLKDLFDGAEANGSAIYNTQTWCDRAQSIDSKTFRTCWMAHRVKLSGATDWTYDTTPIIWSNWGSDGKDGDGVEYIFFLTDTAEEKNGSWTSGAEGFSNYASTASGTVNGVVTTYTNTTNDWVPTGWTDEPQDASPNEGFYEFCSIRRSNAGVWGAFSIPALWSKSAMDGKDGSDIEYVFARINVQCTADQVTVENKEEYKTMTEALPRFKFIETYVQSTDEPQSVSSEYPYQWVSVRRKPAGQATWNDFSEPSLWNNYTKAELDDEKFNELTKTAEEIAQKAVQEATTDLTKATNTISDIQKELEFKDGKYERISSLETALGTYATKASLDDLSSSTETKFTEQKQTIDEFSTSVGALETTVNGKKGEEELGLVSKVTSLTQNVNAISASVSNFQSSLDGKANISDLPDVDEFLTKDDANNTYATITNLETSNLNIASNRATLANVATNFDDLASGFVSVNSKVSYFGNMAGKYLMNSDEHYVNSDGYVIYVTPSTYTDALVNDKYDDTKVSVVYSKDGTTFYVKTLVTTDENDETDVYSYEYVEDTSYSSSNTKLLGTWNLADYVGRTIELSEFNEKYEDGDTIPEGFAVGELTKEAKVLHLQAQKVVARNADEVAKYAEIASNAIAALSTEIEENSATATLSALAEDGKLAQMVLGSIRGSDSESTFVDLVADSFNAPGTVFSVKELKTEIEAQPEGYSTTQTYHLYVGDKYNLKVADEYIESPVGSKYSGIFNSKGTYIGIYEGRPFTVTSNMSSIGVSSFSTTFSNFITSRSYQHVTCYVELVQVDNEYANRSTIGTWDASYNHDNEWPVGTAKDESPLLNGEVYTHTSGNKIASWRFSTAAEKGRGDGKTVKSTATFNGAKFINGDSISVTSEANDTMPDSSVSGTLTPGTYAFRVIWLGRHSGRNSFHVSHANVYLDNTIKVTLTTNTSEDQIGTYLSPQGFMLSTPDKQQISMGIDDNGKIFSKGIVRSTSNITGATSVNNIVVISEADIASATDADTLYIILSE